MPGARRRVDAGWAESRRIVRLGKRAFLESRCQLLGELNDKQDEVVALRVGSHAINYGVADYRQAQRLEIELPPGLDRTAQIVADELPAIPSLHFEDAVSAQHQPISSGQCGTPLATQGRRKGAKEELPLW